MLADAEQGTLSDIVDVTNYPLEPGGGARASDLASDVRHQLTQDGAVTLKDFLRPSALADIRADLAVARPHVPIRRHFSTVYARRDLEASLERDDPRCTPLEWAAGHVTRDMIPAYSPAHRLYVSPEFKGFIAACVGQAQVFEYADPLAGLVATVLPPGGRYPWHYDTNEFVVTIMIDKPAAGGQFEYRKNLRSPGEENLAGLRAVLDGTADDEITVTDNEAGDLQLFLGRYSLHQVTEVTGPHDRVVLVLSYADRPGVIGPLDRTRSVYGRVTEAHLVASQSIACAADGLIL